MEAPAGGPVPALPLQVSAWFPGSSGATPSSAARSETLQCEGPVSTWDSACHPGDHSGSGEVDFQAKGYTFSRPLRLVVSYGKVLGRSSPTSQSSPFSPGPREGAAGNGHR